MAVLKRVLDYEICLWEIEGNALRGIPLLLISTSGLKIVNSKQRLFLVEHYCV